MYNIGQNHRIVGCLHNVILQMSTNIFSIFPFLQSEHKYPISDLLSPIISGSGTRLTLCKFGE